MQNHTIADAGSLLRQYFGYGVFREGQEDIIGHLLAGRDVLGIMPTGAGKSICYQIPALLLDGVSIVISPLISLMKDQVDALRQNGIEAAFINSSLSMQELEKTLYSARNGQYKLIYIAPERLEAGGFLELLRDMRVSMVAVDEAHCVSQWGHDFRPSYRRIRSMLEGFASRPIVSAFTATATPAVRQDILELLGLQEPFVLTTGYDRANLHFAVDGASEKDRFLLDYVRKNRDASGIIYCLTRKNVEAVCAMLCANGLPAVRYHAGLPDQERVHNQEDFINDKVGVIVATNAFGMGIDKSNVRFVIHYNMPRTVENYYQEAGRAGRDGQKSDCVLLYSAGDVFTNRYLIDHGDPDTDKLPEYQKLQEMVDYCNTDGCLRRYILAYFGDDDAAESCGNCGNCGSELESTDITVEAQKILSCVIRMGERFGGKMVIDVLRGSAAAKLKSFGFERLSTYGIMKEYPAASVKELVSYLTAQGYLQVQGGEYPTLAVSAKGRLFLKEKQTLTIRRHIAKQQPRRENAVAHAGLFDKLRLLRREIATELGVPPYIVFSDATLMDMCAQLPLSLEEMAGVSGVGSVKLEQYGAEFLFAVKEYVEENDVPLPVRTLRPAAPARKRDKPNKSDKTPSYQATYELYQQGKTVEEICALRELSPVTIENHLISALEAGCALNYSGFIPVEYREQIFAAIAEAGPERLRPIKELLPDEISYAAIRFALWEWNNQTEPTGGNS